MDMSIIVDGKAIAAEIKKEIVSRIQNLSVKGKPKLAILQIGDDSSSITYSESLIKSAAGMGIEAEYIRHEAASATAEKAEDAMNMLASDKSVHGIILMRPLPKGFSEETLTSSIPPEKDIDCANALSMGLLAIGKPKTLPPTPAACVEILRRMGVETAGKLVAVVGRSNVVGKPLALMLSRKGEGDATVIMCHSRTKNLAQILRQADIVIAAAGSPRLITADMIAPGAVVVDAGINWVEGKMIGDVDFEGVKEIAGVITPVPGGVGPVTRMTLFANLVSSFAK
jgi:methylenetetrahydrofolate dehydrogenase (NADP+) / methenyltetrahydrofolate cyclohydrolase